MPMRTVTDDGRTWQVATSGRVTQYDRDEFALLFTTGEAEHRETRVTRFSPQGTRSREAALMELSEADLLRLLRNSQPGELSPEAGYRA